MLDGGWDKGDDVERARTRDGIVLNICSVGECTSHLGGDSLLLFRGA